MQFYMEALSLLENRKCFVAFVVYSSNSVTHRSDISSRNTTIVVRILEKALFLDTLTTHTPHILKTLLVVCGEIAKYFNDPLILLLY